MQTNHVTNNLIQLTRLRFVNAYLVREDDGFTLVDTTIPGAATDLIGAAEAAGGSIQRIALTHGHTDHIGSLDALKERLGNDVEVLLGDLDARISAGEHVVEGKLPGGWPKVKTVIDTRLKAGDRVGSLEVIETPGHTPGHISYLDTRDRSVITGDVFTGIGGLAVSSHFHLRFPFAWMATWDKAKDLESARTLRGVDPALLAFGHGGPLRSPTAAMDKAISRAQQA